MCTKKGKSAKGEDGKVIKYPGGSRARSQCGGSATTRPAGSVFAQTYSEHGTYVCAIWCFARRLSPAQTRALTGLDAHVVTDLFHNLRLAALATATDAQVGELLGGETRPVVIDECFVSRRKYERGRSIPTHKVCVFGGVEIEPGTHE